MTRTQNNLPRECGHRRRIILAPTDHLRRVGDRDTPRHGAYLAYCTECFWYQGGDLSDIGVAWIEHMEEINGG